MRKSKHYSRTRFTPETIKQAAAVFDREMLTPTDNAVRLATLSVTVGPETWEHQSEDEFFADYRRSNENAVYRRTFGGTLGESYLVVQVVSPKTIVEVQGPQRSKIQAVFEVFERYAPEALLPDELEEGGPAENEPTIFIGHGRSLLWRDLKDHLHEKHGYRVEAYEIGARAGHAIRDILEDMLERSSFAVLVLTAEDKVADGEVRARQNVVHEVGLFQGRLGFSRAIVLAEEETELFSNIEGIDQIRFARGNIRETFGEVLATLRREFGPNAT